MSAPSLIFFQTYYIIRAQKVGIKVILPIQIEDLAIKS